MQESKAMKKQYWILLLSMLLPWVAMSQAVIDASFGNQGRVRTTFGTENDYAEAVAIQADGKLVVAGSTGLSQTTSDIVVARYTTTGSLDLGFGQQGKATLSSSTSFETISAIAILSDGKILLGGRSATASGTILLLARFNANGTPDNSFNSGSNSAFRVIDLPGSSSEVINAMKILPDGKIVVAGTGQVNSLNSGFMVARFNANGTLDNSFSSDGFTIFDFASASSQANDLLVLEDGSLLVGGTAVAFDGGSGTTFNRFALAKIQPNGSFANFGNNGKLLYFSTINNRNAAIFEMKQLPDGKIVLAGQVNRPTGMVNQFQNDLVVAKVNAAGVLDNTFGNTITGVSVVSFGAGVNQNDEYGAITILPNQSMIVSGTAVHGSNTPDVKMVKLNPNGGLDLDFGSPVIVSQVFGNVQSRITGQALDANGKLVLAGGTLVNNDFGFLLTRWTIQCVVNNAISRTICQGETFQFFTNSLTQPGNYTAFRPGDACDTVVTLTLSVTARVTPSVSITANRASPICRGNLVTFNATNLQNQGSNPTYSWKKNGTQVSTNSNYISNNLENNDVVQLEMRSNLQCLASNPAVSNQLIYEVNPIPTPTISRVSDSMRCSVPGESYVWYSCPNFAPIAGANAIAYRPTASGSYAVSVTKSGCTGTSTCFSFNITKANQDLTETHIEVFPNPAHEHIIVSGIKDYTLPISIFSITGQPVLQAATPHQQEGTFTIRVSDLPPGFYYISIEGKPFKFLKD